MQRIAAPMVGGMITSTLLTLIVIPALHFMWRSRQVTEEHDPEGTSSRGPRIAVSDRLSFSP